ncbi:HAMP domain-containing histidine kinase [Dyella sp. LX-66]|uniref:sensor histidine kinase n=1 Tax=unclassified Dyella TaxID=2634549 RepID=UPI001BE09EE8|nr:MULTISPECIES: HAMP domain-containing sensor histidine kinase [unclassified Dyella]MBT2117567.1 HAMP domain-containing histidine kinase [Dyella sp. LX-1]MBT2141429.1 HAMP domain-containing histidine kinase [Dyella sp. LX-66]
MKLRRLFAGRLIVLIVLVSGLNGYAIYRLYNWGLDDSSEFYLWKDAQQASGYYEATGKLPAGDTFRQYFADAKALSARYGQALAKTHWTPDEVTTVDAGQGFLYILPFELEPGHEPAFVVHRFLPQDDAGHTGPSLAMVALILLLLSLPIVAVVAFAMFRSVARPIERLSAWAGTLSGQPGAAPQPAPALPIDELDALAARLHGAMTELAATHQREQYFLQTLSHELRTPLAVTGATLDLLDKKRDALAPWHNQLDRIRRAHGDMRAMTETLLWLWREGRDELPLVAVPLMPLVEQAWRDVSARMPGQAFTLQMDFAPGLTVRAVPVLLQMTMHNLLRNALEHGAPGVIRLSADAESLHLGNAIRKDEPDEGGTHGFGVGLHLVERIAERMGWKVVVSRTGERFEIQLIYAGR